VQFHRIAAAFAWLALVPSAFAEDVARLLPKDGAWARFHWHEHWNDGVERSLYITIKAAGAKFVNNEAHRWVEIKIQSEEPLMKGTGAAFKFLVTQDELSSSSDFIANAVEIWRNSPMQDGAVENLKDEPRVKDNPRLYILFFPWLSGRIRGAADLTERQAVAWQKGQLACRTVEGMVDEKFTFDHIRGRCRLALHPDVPFGVAAARLQVGIAEGDEGTVTVSLVDYGEGARSDLPDVK